MGFGYDQSRELQLRPEPEDKLAAFFQLFGPDPANAWSQKPVPPFGGRAFLAMRSRVPRHGGEGCGGSDVGCSLKGSPSSIEAKWHLLPLIALQRIPVLIKRWKMSL